MIGNIINYFTIFILFLGIDLVWLNFVAKSMYTSEIGASQPLKVWREKGWIHNDDPRGWFQWYCRYFMGRRHEDGMRQIKRWKAMTRHIAQIKRNCMPGDLSCRRKQRQALLHWAYDSRLI